MNSKRLISYASLATAFSLMLAACASPAAAPAPTTAPVAAATEAPAAPAATEAPVATEAPAAEATAAMTTTEAMSETMVTGTATKLEAPNCDYGGNVKSIEAVDATTVKIVLCTSDPAFPSKIAFNSFGILDKDFLDSVGGDTAKINEAPVGTGPYKLTEWKRGESMTFEANPDYFAEKPASKTIIYRWQKEAAQRLVELQSGTVDGIAAVAPEDFETVEGDTNLKLYPGVALNVFYLGLNNAKPPLDNEKVRQAIGMAIDKQRLIDNFYPAGSFVAEQFAPETLVPGFSKEGDGAKWYGYDVEAAKKLLAEAGFPDGFEISLSFRDVVRGYLPQPAKVAQDLQAQLAEIGVKVTINVMESGAFLQSVSDGNESMFMLGWGADYPDATNFYDFHFTGASKNFGAPYPDLVEAIKKAGSSADPVVRQTAYDEVNTLVKQHVPMVPIANGGNANAWKAGTQNVKLGPIGQNMFQISNGTDQLVWLKNAEPISLWAGDETDGETLEATSLLYDSLLRFEPGGVAVQPGLAESYEANADLTEWTFKLRTGVKFSNGADFDSSDVLATLTAIWDANNPNHKGNSGQFEYWQGFFGSLLNAPKAAP